MTICTARKRCLFGRVERGEMHLNKVGEIVRRLWQSLPERFPGVGLDAFVVMPDHVHGILVFQPSAAKAGRASPAPTSERKSLGSVVGAFKSQSTAAVNRLLGRSGSVWQRNYYEHIIRSGEDLDEIRSYIAENPGRWASEWKRPG